MEASKFLDHLKEFELELFSKEFNRWVQQQSDENKKKIRGLRTKVSNYRSKLETNHLKVMADKLDKLAPEWIKAKNELQKDLEEMNNFIKCIELLEGVIGLVGSVTAVA